MCIRDRPQAAMIRCTAGTPATYIQPAPETATPLAAAGCPQVRLAGFYEPLATSVRAYFQRCVPTVLSKWFRITRMKSHPSDKKINLKTVFTGRVAVGGLAVCPIPGISTILGRPSARGYHNDGCASSTTGNNCQGRDPGHIALDKKINSTC